MPGRFVRLDGSRRCEQRSGEGGDSRGQEEVLLQALKKQEQVWGA